VSDLAPTLDSIYLWPDALVAPDRERIQDQRICAVDNPSFIPFWPLTTAPSEGYSAVLIFPGGGYTRLAVNHEGYDIARWFSERGVAAFVVKYRLQEYGFPAALLDGLRAMRILRQRAAEWNINPAAIGVVGFSAGGHVAASVALRSGFSAEDQDSLAEIEARPNFAVLGYPLITLVGSDAHAGCRKALLGDDPDPQLLYENSLQFQVHEDVPPMFIFHGIADQAVPVGNSLAFFDEIAKYSHESELHIYQTAIHGVGMIQGQGSVSGWPVALELWLRQNGFMAGVAGSDL
jgi:acetyl esterase/lipase